MDAAAAAEEKEEEEQPEMAVEAEEELVEFRFMAAVLVETLEAELKRPSDAASSTAVISSTKSLDISGSEARMLMLLVLLMLLLLLLLLLKVLFLPSSLLLILVLVLSPSRAMNGLRDNLELDFTSNPNLEDKLRII